MFFKQKIKSGYLYAINTGTYMGQFILFINLDNNILTDHYDVLMINGTITNNDGTNSFESLKIPKKDIDEGLKKKIIEKFKRLPDNVYNLCKAQWVSHK